MQVSTQLVVSISLMDVGSEVEVEVEGGGRREGGREGGRVMVISLASCFQSSGFQDPNEASDILQK